MKNLRQKLTYLFRVTTEAETLRLKPRFSGVLLLIYNMKFKPSVRSPCHLCPSITKCDLCQQIKTKPLCGSENLYYIKMKYPVVKMPSKKKKVLYLNSPRTVGKEQASQVQLILDLEKAN